eukprot:CAMPEP_0116898884 /NCGR_PEP_ID=MMETSP0467-20121206/7543_1 /TAXON_ID=283647 /ORGANISM="Mesodinium pulex, Strain SPMC105" /LENGTH=59 /DNA_ID=CAMNT_0004571331 /DNA_START=554 /DNA_END=733 /DNA_ORIENTATION=+
MNEDIINNLTIYEEKTALKQNKNYKQPNSPANLSTTSFYSHDSNNVHTNSQKEIKQESL